MDKRIQIDFEMKNEVRTLRVREKKGERDRDRDRERGGEKGKSIRHQ